MKYRCSLPWTGFSNEPDGRAQPCCLYKGYITDEKNQPMYVQNYTVDEILKSKFMKDLRQEFREGKKPKGCEVCWTDEENGYESKRIIYNTKINHDPEIIWEEEPEFLSEFQLIINNSCNLKCRSCTPSHSTQWQLEIKKLTGETGYPMPYRQSGDDLGKLWLERKEWYKNLRRLEVVGGEPFYVKQWHIIFNELIEMGYSKDIDLTLTTNCTLFYPDLIDKISKNFKSVSVGLSIDGTETVYEYIRHPGKWQNVYDNMKKYYLYADYINVQINITISWLNSFELSKLHNLLYREFPKFKIWNNLVHSPSYLSLKSIPDKFKNDVENNWNNFSWKEEYQNTISSIISFMKSDSTSEETFRKNLEILYATDNLRNENIKISIPDVEKYL